ncbi:MAG: TolC family protein, partial [Thermoanaerobaculia bacterium]|nr:TolC family protein [Thermoanaerobaculia bacterium]
APRLGIVPSLDLRGTWRWTNEAGLSGREEDWNLGLGLTWSIWDGGEREALAAQRDAEAREAGLVFERERRALAVEVESALADLATAEAAREQAEVRLAVATQNAEEVRERFLNGLATALEQADALVGQFEADAALAREQFAVSLSRLALERAVGLWPAGLDASVFDAARENEP